MVQLRWRRYGNVSDGFRGAGIVWNNEMKGGPGTPPPEKGDMDRDRCMVCAKSGAFEGGICDPCKAKIRGEAREQQQQIKKDSDRTLHKEGTVIEKKSSG
jgi:hypothetical protein